MAAAELKTDPFSARDTFDTGSGEAGIYRLSKLEELGLTKVAELPFSIRVLLESCLRNCDGYVVTEGAVLGVLLDVFGNELTTIRAPFSGIVNYVISTPPVSKGEPVAMISKIANR